MTITAISIVERFQEDLSGFGAGPGGIGIGLGVGVGLGPGPVDRG